MTGTAPTEVKKMKQGMSYSRKEKTIILNVFKYFRSQYPDKTVTEIVRRTAKATGCSEKSIFSFRKEEVSPQGFKEPSKTKIRKNVSINNRLIKYNEGVREGIKNIIYDLKSKNIVPSLSLILRNINHNNLPSFSIMTLRRLLYDMGFYYEKNGNKSILMEKGVQEKKDGLSINVKSPLNIEKTKPTENIDVVSNKVNEKNKSQFVQHMPVSFNRDISKEKLNGEILHSYTQINAHQRSRIDALGTFQENHYSNLGPAPSSHIPIMFPPRMPPYHLPSSVPHPYSPNMDLHFKRQECTLPPHHQDLTPHNVGMQSIH